MDLTQLRYFQVVARCGNVTRAARELYVTQPVLSKSIARLEKELGVPLFEHRKGHIELNTYGQIFHAAVDAIFSQLHTTTQTIQRMYESDQQVLSLGSNIPSYLSDVLPPFCHLYPEFGIRQIDCTTGYLIEHLLDHTLTLAISNEVIEHKLIDFRILDQTRYVLVISHDHPLARKRSVSIRDLDKEVFICDTNRFRPDTLQKLCQQYGFTPNIVFEIQSTDLLSHLLLTGRGVSILPLALSTQIIKSAPDTQLRVIPLQEPLPPVIIGIARHRNLQCTRAVELFEQYIADRLAEEKDEILRMGLEYI